MTSNSLQATEELGARGAVAPRVSLADIEANILTEHYLNAGEALCALGHHVPGNTPKGSALGLLTVCFLNMRNGFIVIGKSAPASAENYDEEKGRTFAREDAIRQLWPLMGFALRQRLAEAAPSGTDGPGRPS